MPVPTPTPTPLLDLAEHLSTVLTILGVVFSILLGAIGFIMVRVWKNIDSLHNKVDDFMKLHYKCQVDLPLRFVDRATFNDWRTEWKEFLKERKKEWENYWAAFNGHRHHSSNGAVIRRDKFGEEDK